MDVRGRVCVRVVVDASGRACIWTAVGAGEAVATESDDAMEPAVEVWLVEAVELAVPSRPDASMLTCRLDGRNSDATEAVSADVDGRDTCDTVEAVSSWNRSRFCLMLMPLSLM